MPNRLFTVDNMSKCPKGRYGGGGECCSKKCEAGSYALQTGKKNKEEACVPCSEGFYCLGWVQDTVTKENEQFYEPIECPAGYYCGKGVTEGVPCEVGTSTDGKTKYSSCTPCVAGTIAAKKGQAMCSACPPGTIQSKSGESRCMTCPKFDGCLEGGVSCAPGYEGSLCGVCTNNSEEKFYEASGKCVKCTSNWTYTLLGLGLVVTIVALLSRLDLTLHHILRIKIYSTFFQLMNIALYVEVPWPPLAVKFTDLFHFLTFNVQVAHPECYKSFSYLEKYDMVVGIAIAIAVVLSIVSFSLYRQMQRSNAASDYDASSKFRKRWRMCRQLMVIFATSVYCPLCFYSFRFFQECVEDPNGSKRMANDMSIECETPGYKLHVFIAVLVVSLVGVGIPLSMLTLVLWLRRKHLLNTGDSLLKYGKSQPNPSKKAQTHKPAPRTRTMLTP